MPPAIRVDKLCKRYLLGAGQADATRTLREAIMATVELPWRRIAGRRPQNGTAAQPDDCVPAGEPRQSIWALRDVSFEVQPGEIVGVIGHNGAGKSTLLKILSRITRPTSGRVEVRGRLGSLLEVGTGFHSELTGRENIYLNGSILGMSKREIARKFDEIVDFAEVERFLDTPVKRYSSGMYVRLAFAVAAHLEPDILLVDEVLAVGDVAFQQKCLGKMRQVGQGGRAVLYVSHNMATIAGLCRLAVTLDGGRIAGMGSAGEQISQYLATLRRSCDIDLGERSDRSGSGAARVVGVEFLDQNGYPVDQLFSGDPLTVSLHYRSSDLRAIPSINIAFYNDLGAPMTFLSNDYSGEPLGPLSAQGRLVCRLPQLPLAPGAYLLNVCLLLDGRISDHIAGAAKLQVVEGHFFRSGKTPPASFGCFLCEHRWSAEAENADRAEALGGPRFDRHGE